MQERHDNVEIAQERHDNVIIMSHNHEYPLLYKKNRLSALKFWQIFKSAGSITQQLCGPRAGGVHIRQATSACATTINSLTNTVNGVGIPITSALYQHPSPSNSAQQAFEVCMIKTQQFSQ